MSRDTRHIAVIGAGYTGMVAAYRLAQQGHTVTVFEAGSYPGGLAGDFSIEGAPIEMAYHHLFKTDTDILSLVRELGIEDKLTWRDSSLSIYYEDTLYPFMTATDLLKFRPLSFINRIRAGLVVLYLQKQKNWKPFVHQTALDWMTKHAGAQVTKVIWRPLLLGKFDKYYDKVSMAWLWARLHIRANSREKGDSGEKLGYFNGGFKVVTDAIFDACKAKGIRFHTNVRISHIGNTGQKPYLIIDDKKRTFDSVVATVPSHIMARLLSEEHAAPQLQAYTDKLQSIDYLDALLMVFSSTQDISPYYWHNINDTTKPFLVFIHHTRLMPKEHYGNKYVYYIGAYLNPGHKLLTLSDKDLSKLWFAELTKIFPDFSPKAISEQHIFRMRNAQHIVDTEYEQKIPAHTTPVPNVFLANFSQIFPEDRGTNYAVREGNRIAETVNMTLKRKK